MSLITVLEPQFAPLNDSSEAETQVGTMWPWTTEAIPADPADLRQLGGRLRRSRSSQPEVQEAIRGLICELQAATSQFFSAGPRLVHDVPDPELKEVLLECAACGPEHLTRLEQVRAAFPPAPDGFSDAVETWLRELWNARSRQWLAAERAAGTAIVVKHILSYLDGLYLPTIQECQQTSRERIAECLSASAQELHRWHGPLSRVLSKLLAHRQGPGLAGGVAPTAVLEEVAEVKRARRGDRRRPSDRRAEDRRSSMGFSRTSAA